MEILVPFLRILERYNGMAMVPAPDMEVAAEDPFRDAFKSTIEATAPPALTLVANS